MSDIPKGFESHCRSHNDNKLGFCHDGFQQNYGCLNWAIKKCNCGTILTTTPYCLMDEPPEIRVRDYIRVREMSGYKASTQLNRMNENE